jgi:hypothetical protein
LTELLGINLNAGRISIRFELYRCISGAATAIIKQATIASNGIGLSQSTEKLITNIDLVFKVLQPIAGVSNDSPQNDLQ